MATSSPNPKPNPSPNPNPNPSTYNNGYINKMYPKAVIRSKMTKCMMTYDDTNKA